MQTFEIFFSKTTILRYCTQILLRYKCNKSLSKWWHHLHYQQNNSKRQIEQLNQFEQFDIYPNTALLWQKEASDIFVNFDLLA